MTPGGGPLTVGNDHPMTYTPHNREDSDAIPPGKDGPGIPERDCVDLGKDSGALLATVPGMLGFRPENSLVILGLSGPPDPADRPAGVGRNSQEIGPVVRADLTVGAVRGAVRTLARANRGRVDSGAVIIVVGGDAGPLVGTTARILREQGVDPVAAFVATDLCAGAVWWEIPVDGGPPGSRDDGRDWAGGRLPDPEQSPTAGRDRPGLVGQQEFDGLLDPRPVPGELHGTLPDSWRDVARWEETTGGTSREAEGQGQEDRTVRDNHQDSHRDIAGICALVDELGEPPGETGAERTGEPGTGVDAGTVHLLGREGVPGFLATVCDRRDLFPVLVVLAAGPRAETVGDLLTTVSALSRGLLRQRALALLSVVTWCRSGGVLAHRAAHRAVSETVDAPRRGWTTGKGADLRRSLARAELTLKIAGPVMVCGRRGTPAPVIGDLLEEGLRLLDRALRHCPREDREEFGALLDRVLDRGQVSVVRSALGRRARR